MVAMNTASSMGTTMAWAIEARHNDNQGGKNRGRDRRYQPFCFLINICHGFSRCGCLNEWGNRLLGEGRWFAKLGTWRRMSATRAGSTSAIA